MTIKIPARYLRILAPVYERVYPILSTYRSGTPMYHHSGRRLWLSSPQDQKPNGCCWLPPNLRAAIQSRMVERIVVRVYLYPAIRDPQFSGKIVGQYAFRPTGSTRGARRNFSKGGKSFTETFIYILHISVCVGLLYIVHCYVLCVLEAGILGLHIFVCKLKRNIT